MREALRRPRSLAGVVAALTLTLLLADASLVAEASSGAIRLVVTPPAGPLLVGAPTTLAVRAIETATGHPSAGVIVTLESPHQSVRTSSDGWAFFRVQENSPKTRVATWSAYATDGATLLLNWTRPRAEVLAPDEAMVDRAIEITVRATWSNGTGIPNASAGLFQDHALVTTSTTDASGLATLAVPAAHGPGSLQYGVAFDDPSLQAAATSFRIRWVPQPVPENRQPVPRFEINGDRAPGASLTFDGRASFDPDGTIASHAWTFSDGATATGAVASHAFAQAGDAWADLTVTDDDGAAHRLRRDFFLVAPTPAPSQPPPQQPEAQPEPEPEAQPPPFEYTDSAGTTHVLLGHNESETQLVRAVDLPEGTQVLLDTPTGLTLWDPSNDMLAPVSATQANVTQERYEPGALAATIALDCEGWCLARFPDPGPGWTFQAESDAGPVVAWREGNSIVILSTRASILVRFQVPTLQLDATAQETADGRWVVSARQTQGAPIVSIDVRVGDKQVAHADGPALDATIDAQPGELVVVAARAASGETIVRDLGALAGEADETPPEDIEPAGQPVDGAKPPTTKEAPGVGLLALVTIAGAISLALGRKK